MRLVPYGPVTDEPLVWQTMYAFAPLRTRRIVFEPVRGSAFTASSALPPPLNVPTCATGCGQGTLSTPQAGLAWAAPGATRKPTAAAAATAVRASGRDRVGMGGTRFFGGEPDCGRL